MPYRSDGSFTVHPYARFACRSICHFPAAPGGKPRRVGVQIEKDTKRSLLPEWGAFNLLVSLIDLRSLYFSDLVRSLTMRFLDLFGAKGIVTPCLVAPPQK